MIRIANSVLSFRHVRRLRTVQGEDAAASFASSQSKPLGRQPWHSVAGRLWRLGWRTKSSEQRLLRGRGPHRLRVWPRLDCAILLLGSGTNSECDTIVSRTLAPVASHLLCLSHPPDHHVHLFVAHERHRPPEQSHDTYNVSGQRGCLIRHGLRHICTFRGASHTHT